MQDWPDANSWIAEPEILLSDLVDLSGKFDDVMMRSESGSSEIATGDLRGKSIQMEEVDTSWATFAATVRTFSQRLRAAQTMVAFPLDAVAIMGVADLVDEINYGPQRWQNLTEEADRKITPMELKETYFEQYVAGHRIFVDGLATLREWVNVMRTAKRDTADADKHSVDGGKPKGSGEEQPDVSDGPGFRSVLSYGTKYSFTLNQSKVVELLYQTWEKGTPAVPDVHLLDAYGGDGKRVRDVFKEAGNKINKAYGTMIQRGRRGTHQLEKPKTPSIPT